MDNNGNWRKDFMFYDHLGSVRVVLRDTSEEDFLSYYILDQYDYEPFGEVLFHNNGLRSRNTFIGKEKDWETMIENYRGSLADHGVRKYEDFSGRFTSPDPLWEKYYGWSPYHYCRNNPLNLIDPNGMFESNTTGNARVFSDKNGDKYIKPDLDKNIKIEVTTSTMNCVGFAMAYCNTEVKNWDANDSKSNDKFYTYNIDPSNAKYAAKADGYKNETTLIDDRKDIDNSSKVKNGDLIFYYKGNSVTHASRVSEVKKDGTIMVVEVEESGRQSKSREVPLRKSIDDITGSITKTTFQRK